MSQPSGGASLGLWTSKEGNLTNAPDAWNVNEISFPVDVDSYQHVSTNDIVEPELDGVMADVLSVPSEGPLWPEEIFAQFIGVGDFYPVFPSPSNPDQISVPEISRRTASVSAGLARAGISNGFATDFDSSTPLLPSPDIAAISTEFRGQTSDFHPSGQEWSCPVGRSLTRSDLSQRDQCMGGDCRHHTISLRLRSDGDTGQDISTSTVPNDGTVAGRATNTKPDFEPGLPELSPWLECDDAPYSRHFDLPLVDNATHTRMQQCLQVPLSRTLWDPISLASFPSASQIDYLVDLYFSHFDMVSLLVA